MRTDYDFRIELSQLFDNGDLDAVARLLNTVKDSDSNDPVVRHARAQLNARRGNLAETCELLESLCHDFPGDSQFALELANTRLSMGDTQRAEATLRKLLRRDPAHPRANQKLGVCLKRQGMLEAAKTQFQRVLQLNAADANALFQLGLLAFEQRDQNQCIAYLTRCVEVAPQHTEARIMLGRCHQISGQIEHALVQYKAAVRLDSKLYYRVAKNLVSGPHGVFWLRSSSLREALGLDICDT